MPWAMAREPKEYWEIIEQYPRLQGGFVWEWLDHGLPFPLVAAGCLRLRGGLRRRPQRRELCDRRLAVPGPAPVSGAGGTDQGPTAGGHHLAGPRRGTRMRNRYDFLSLSHLEGRWSLPFCCSTMACSWPRATGPLSAGARRLPSGAAGPLPAAAGEPVFEVSLRTRSALRGRRPVTRWRGSSSCPARRRARAVPDQTDRLRAAGRRQPPPKRPAPLSTVR